MADSSSENDERLSSPSVHSPSEERPSRRSPSPDSESETMDPEQDALVGEKSLDNRFNKTQLELLVSRKEEYRHAGAKQRKELALRTGETIAAEMITSGVNMSEDNRAALFENVKLWFSQRARTRKEPLQWTVHWSGREVFYKDNKEKVLSAQNRLYEAYTGKKAGNEENGLLDPEDMPEPSELPEGKAPQPFHFFQRALSTEWEALTKKEREEYEEKAIIWRSLGPNEEERRRLAEQHAPRTIRSLATSLYRQMGVRMFVLATWEDTQGRVITVPLDFNHELGSDGRSYKIEHRAYLEKIGLLDHYASFTQKIWTDKTANVVRDTSPMDISFKTTEEGRPILPDPSIPHPILKPFKHLPNVVRKFMDADYGLSRGIPVNRRSGHQVPWLQLQTRLEEFIDPIYLPEGWTSLKDPGGLGVNSCRALLNHWWKRQQGGLIPFEFHQWEASPAVYDADGATLKKPAKMVAREPLPLPAEFNESEGEDTSKKPKPKPKAKRTRTKKPKPKSSLPTVIPSNKSQDKRRQSTSCSPSKARLSSSKRRQEPTSIVSEDDDAISENPSRGRQRGRAKGRKGGRRSITPDSDASSDSPVDQDGGRSKRRSALPDLVDATKDLSLGEPRKSVKAGNIKGKGQQEVERNRDRKKTKKAEKGTAINSANSKGKEPGKGKGGRNVFDDDQGDSGEEATIGDKNMRQNGGMSEDNDEMEEEDKEDEEDGREVRPSSSRLKSVVAKKKKEPTAMSEKKVKWKDVVKKGEGMSEGLTGPKGLETGPQAKGTRKQSAEDRDLLALANSPRYRVDSPTRRRPKSARVMDS